MSILVNINKRISLILRFVRSDKDIFIYISENRVTEILKHRKKWNHYFTSLTLKETSIKNPQKKSLSLNDTRSMTPFNMSYREVLYSSIIIWIETELTR